MLNLLCAEWIKLSRRPLTWILLVVFLGLMLVYLATLFLVVALHDGIFSGGELRFQMLRAEQIHQYRLQLSFPGIFGTVLGQVNSIGGICAIILAAGALGSEYNWGTLRIQLARAPRRGPYLVAKIVGVCLILLTGICIAIAMGTLLGMLFSALLETRSQVRGQELLLLPLGIFRALYVMLPYLMFTIACCTLGRSVLAGTAGGLIFLTLDVSAGALAFLPNVSGTVAFMYSLLVQQNINTLVVLNSRSFGLDPALLMRNLDLDVLPSPLQATVIVAVYTALFFVSAYYWFARRDITGAA